MKTQFLEKGGKRRVIKAQVAGRKREKRGQKLAQDLRVDIISCKELNLHLFMFPPLCLNEIEVQ